VHTAHTIKSLLVAAREVVSNTRETIEAERIWLRKRSSVDLILGAHLNRVFRAVESVFAIAELGAGHDATALSRIVLEHALSAASVAMGEDPERESYLFITAQHRHVRNSHDALRKYYPDLTEPDATTSSFVKSLVDQVNRSGFLEKLQPIVKRLDEIHSPNEKMFSWLYDVPYSAMSNYVHARALGLRTMTPLLGQPFTFIASKEDELAMNAVRHAMIGLLVVCMAVVHSWTPSYEEQRVLAPIEEFVRTSGQAGQFGTFEI
jgi:hypothetical protein